MENRQNPTIEKVSITDTNIERSVDKNILSTKQRQWIDYVAVQGLMTDADGTPTKMTVTQFAKHIGVNKDTLYEWRKRIPDFWEQVKNRSHEIFSQTRTIKVWNSLYISATAKLDVRAQQTWLANVDPSFRMPSQKMEHEFTGGMADLLDRARSITQQSQDHSQAIEGEIINDNQTINS